MFAVRYTYSQTSNSRPPHPEPALPGDFADQPLDFHTGQVALHGRAARAGQCLRHRGLDQRPFAQRRAQGRRCAGFVANFCAG